MIKKKENKTNVRVTFELPGDVAEESAAVVGDFNDWDASEGEMDYIKTRDVWKKGVSFDHGATVEFRYLIDGSNWVNDADADRYVANEYFEDNCVIDL
jgi:1,4-alpha-glucan branching enzyme